MTAGLIKANILVSDRLSIHVNLTFPKYIHCSFIRWADLTGVHLHICCAFLKGPISISNGKAVISPGLFCGTQTEFEWCIIYIYAFSRRFYPNHIQVIHFLSVCGPWELNPQPFALLTQCSTTEPQEHWHHSCEYSQMNTSQHFGLFWKT